VNDSALLAPAQTAAEIGATLADIVEEAAQIILPFWRSDLEVETKTDDSPVTQADRAAEAHILKRLHALFPGACIVSEEDASEYGTPDAVGRRFFLVDPLDGTRGFVRGGESYTVNIGLIEDGRPVAGAVAAPASGTVWYTAGEGAMRRRFGETQATPVRVRQKPEGRGVALLSHTVKDDEAERLCARHGCTSWQGLDSSVKFCLIAEGRADVYPRPGRTMEWDTAAAHAVLAAAGGRVLTMDGEPLAYGKADRGFENPGFLAVGA